IAYINSGKFRVQTEEQQRLWNDCSRLIANAIIYYNTVLLSKIYDRKLEANALDEIAVLKSISPVGWRHTNLFGNLEFSESDRVIDLDSIAIGFDLSRIGEALVVSEGTGFD
ncbi:MAG TPA: Tn3 family transposase, partial [Rhodanobacteraceae bacterium]|nr:Tn3 family transposase [Rhodanobacteraceae bacterium]